MGTIPIVQVLPLGDETLVGIATTMDHAESLLHWFAETHPHRTYYIDCARTVDQVIADSRKG